MEKTPSYSSEGLPPDSRQILPLPPRSSPDGRLLFIEADIRPNAWVEASRIFADDPVPAIRAALETGGVLAWPPPRESGPPTVDLPCPFRMGAFELLTNRHGVWRTFGEHAPVDLIRYLGGPAWRLIQGLLRRLGRG